MNKHVSVGSPVVSVKPGSSRQFFTSSASDSARRSGQRIIGVSGRLFSSSKMKLLVCDEKLDGFCVQTINSIQSELHSTLSFGLSLVCEQGIPVAPESDLYGTISSVLLEAANGRFCPTW